MGKKPNMKKRKVKYKIDTGHKPNLFDFAVSELSQDAFIAWLASWADWKSEFSYPKMHELGRHFIKSLAPSIKFPQRIEGKEGVTVEVCRQYKNIDLIIDVGQKDLIVIEDKVHASDHDGQLEKYWEIMNDEVLGEGKYAGRKLHFIYLKTGDEAMRTPDELCGFCSYGRRSLLKVLHKGAEIDNSILRDFTDKLQIREDAVKAYSRLPRYEWTYDQWTGFFTSLCNTIRDGANFSWINNQRGGFMAAWFPFVSTNFRRDLGHIYLQLDAKASDRGIKPELTLRISGKDKIATRRYKEYVQQRLLEALNQNEALRKLGITISSKNLRYGASMRLLTFENAVSQGIDESYDCVFNETLHNIHVIQEIAYELSEKGII